MYIVIVLFRVPQETVSDIRKLPDTMRTCLRHDDEECSGWFHVEKGACQESRVRVYALLLNFLFATVIHVAFTRFEANNNIRETRDEGTGDGG